MWVSSIIAPGQTKRCIVTSMHICIQFERSFGQESSESEPSESEEHSITRSSWTAGLTPTYLLRKTHLFDGLLSFLCFASRELTPLASSPCIHRRWNRLCWDRKQRACLCRLCRLVVLSSCRLFVLSPCRLDARVGSGGGASPSLVVRRCSDPPDGLLQCPSRLINTNH